MLRNLGLMAVLLAAGPALAAESEFVALSAAACARLVQHVPRDDVTYKPGVDVRGNAVVPADIGGGAAITMPDEINIQIGIDLADRLALRESRKTTPGLPGATAPIRKVLPYEGKAAIGELTIKGNDAYWNGARIGPQDEVQLAEACRKGMSDAGVMLPEHKPEPPKP